MSCILNVFKKKKPELPEEDMAPVLAALHDLENQHTPEEDKKEALKIIAESPFCCKKLSKETRKSMQIALG